MKKTTTCTFICLSLFLQVLLAGTASSQIIISGTVYDSSKVYVIPGVTVYSTSGAYTITDSLGGYHIPVRVSDSLSFFLNGKSTVKFPVEEMSDYTAFDISLRAQVSKKYKLLKDITVYSNNYRLDSLENRVTYEKIFNSQKPTIRSTYEPGGPAGLDLDALIGIFQLRKNKQNLAFQKRLIEEEQERFVDYRFNSKTITRITGLKGEMLSSYEKIYRPYYYFARESTLAQFYQYILSTSYVFKKEWKLNH